jgi:hypothetical protein
MAIEGYLIKQCDDHPDIAPIGIQDGIEASTEQVAKKVGHGKRAN